MDTSATRQYFAILPDRGVVAVGGPDARHFLDNLLTVDTEAALQRGAAYGGLLTPQGKIQFDFILFAAGDGFLFDIAVQQVGDFVRRLGLYKLRANVMIADRSAELTVLAGWGGITPRIDGTVATDPREPRLGWRAAVARGSAPPDGFELAAPADYAAHRIAVGVPEGGTDFGYGDAFPHDADMDQLGGLDFRKGCYVGQEVVSRMEHRGTARRRLIRIASTIDLPPTGTDVTAEGRVLGSVASVAGKAGLAMIRLDRAREALDASHAILAGGVPVTLAIPGWARFGWPEPAAAE